MKFNFRSFHSEADLQRTLEERLPIGSATPTNVLTFVKEHKIECSGIIDETQFDQEYEMRSPYEATIFCSAPARGHWRWWFATAKWQIKFHFNDNKLAEIQVEKGWISL